MSHYYVNKIVQYRISFNSRLLVELIDSLLL